MLKPSPWRLTPTTHNDAALFLPGRLNDAITDAFAEANREGRAQDGLKQIQDNNLVQFAASSCDPKDVYAASYRTANLLAALHRSSVGPADHFPYMIATYPEQFGRHDLGSDKPVWGGDRQPGKTLLIHAVKLQGLGDVFQFAPLVNEAKAQGRFDTVVFEVPKRMIPLFEGKGLADMVVGKGDPLPAHDYTLPMMSLPSVLGVNLHTYQAPEAYLAPTWKIGTAENDWINANIRRPQQQGGLVVGLAWQGDAGNFSLEPQRSMNLAQLHPLLALENTQFICLQNPMDVPKSPLAEQFAALNDAQRGKLTVLPAEFDKAVMFGDTMHAMKAMDLVLSTDTGTAHAAGAAGARLVIMAQYGAELRYPSVALARMTGGNSPSDGTHVQAMEYYANATLLQQKTQGDWGSVVSALRDELEFANQSGYGVVFPVRQNRFAPG